MKNHSWNKIKESFKERSQSKISKILDGNEGESLLLTSSSDIGVIRNSGRQGARLGARALKNELAKLEAPINFNQKIKLVEVADQQLEINDFDKAQRQEAELIKKQLNQKYRKVIHLGGGHDHIYPLLMAMEEYKNILILNIDAHLDTRVDDWAHSGTPFRQFSDQTTSEFNLLQLGVHSETNNSKNYTKLNNGHMKPLPFTKQEHLENILQEISEINHDCLVLSIDCDGIDSNDVEAVSAPAYCGTPFHLVEELILKLKDDPTPQFLGVYEFNPTFDSVSGKSAKKVSWLINKFIF